MKGVNDPRLNTGQACMHAGSWNEGRSTPNLNDACLSLPFPRLFPRRLLSITPYPLWCIKKKLPSLDHHTNHPPTPSLLYEIIYPSAHHLNPLTASMTYWSAPWFTSCSSSCCCNLLSSHNKKFWSKRLSIPPWFLAQTSGLHLHGGGGPCWWVEII